MNRHEKMREARRLRELSWTAPEIGRELGVSESTVRNWYLGGDCVDCGVPLDGCEAKKSVRCQPCHRAHVEPPHGTCSRFSRPHHCRCDACLQAVRDDHKRRRDDSMARGYTPSHGVSGYFNYGCKCSVCRAAGSAKNRADRERRKAAA